VSNGPGTFVDSVIYAGSCQSTANATLSDAFINKDADAFFGFSDVVNSSYAESASNDLFDNMVTSLQNTLDAYTPVTPKTDPSPPNAAFARAGSDTLIYTANLKNGGFESGNLSGWTRTGDGRVIQKLGSFQPREGSFMGIISTGLGFTTDSGMIEQDFCFNPGDTTLSFEWNFSSEEMLEWCGQYDDPFEVHIVEYNDPLPPTVTLLMQETVDTLCASAVETSLYFDKAGPGCVESSANDCKVYSSGWRSADIDISSFALANPDREVTLIFSNTDSIDSVWDSAVLLDDIEVSGP
jgi:hypothetical protein